MAVLPGVRHTVCGFGQVPVSGYVSSTQLHLAVSTDEELAGMLRSAERHPDREVGERVRVLVEAEQEIRQRAN